MTRPTESRAERMRRRLEALSSMAALLVEELEASRGSSEPNFVRRAGRAQGILDALTWPIAAFLAHAQTPWFTNPAWTSLHRGLTEGATWQDHVARVLATEELVYLAELTDHLTSTSAFIAPVRSVAGDLAGVVIVCGDVTDDVVARRLGAEPNALMWAGAVGHTCDYVGRDWIEYTGRSLADERLDWQSSIHPDDRPGTARAFAASKGGTPTSIEARIRRVDGEHRWHRITFTCDVPARRWYGMALDVHETRAADNARADAEHANRLKDQFLAAVSHELRAPLTTLLLWEKVLREHPDDPAMRDPAIEAIHQSAVTQARLVGDLLDISRAISGKLHLDLRTLAIEDLVQAAIVHIATAAKEKGVSVDVELALSSVLVEGDPIRLAQVLENLLSNAIKFTDPGGSISVRGTHAGGSVVITVRDTGQGISSEFLPHIFEPFSQSDDTLGHSAGGLGLGLAIADQLLALHGGDLVAFSAGRGHGATFTVTLPLSRARRPSRATPAAGTPTTRLQGIRVLVIDDDARVRDALTLLLGRTGATVEGADSSEHGMAAVTAFAPQVILCDIAMPGEDGYAFVRRLRAGGSAKQLPVIALTAHATGADAEQALAAGFDLHLAKPIDLQALYVSIEALVASRSPA